MTEHQRILKSASLITALTLMSRVLGYIRDSRVAFLLGAGTIADAFFTAYRIPNLIRRLVGEGAVSAAFIPVLSRYIVESKEEEGWKVVNTILTVLTMLMTAVTVLGIVFSPLLVRLFASGFVNTPGKLELTAGLNRIMFPYIFFMSLSALVMGILNSFHRFGPPAFAPVVMNLTVIAFSFLGSVFGSDSTALAAGVVLGGLLQLAVQVPAALKCGWKIRVTASLSHPGVRRIARLLLPVVFATGIVQVNVLVGTQFASYLEEGSVAAIYIANRVMELILGGYAVAISTVILPILSRQAASRRIEDMKATLNFSIRVIVFITLPATVGLILLRKEIIEVLFQRGDFDSASTALTAWPVPFFAVGLTAFSLIKVVVPAFYAVEDTRTPVKIAFGALLLNIVLNFIFIRPLQNGGPALAASLAALFNSIALLVVFHRRYGTMGLSRILLSVSKFTCASLALGAVAYLLIHWPGFYAGDESRKALALGVTISISAGTYFLCVFVLRARELGELRAVKEGRPEAL